MEFDGFDWDDGNWPKCGKHGVSKEEIEAAMSARELTVLEDTMHSAEESRFLAIATDPELPHSVWWVSPVARRMGRCLSAR